MGKGIRRKGVPERDVALHPDRARPVLAAEVGAQVVEAQEEVGQFSFMPKPLSASTKR